MLNRIAVRLCAVFAVMDKTFADDFVRDSQITLIDPENDVEENHPFVAVYTDDQDGDELVLSFEIGVSARMVLPDQVDGKDVIVPGIPPTDAGIELVLDAIERQIHIALADEKNAWAELLRTVFSWEAKPKSIRGAAKTNSGERYAGRQILIQGTPLKDPEFGRELSEDGFWHRFLAQIDSNSGLAGYGQIIRTLLGSENADVDWRLVMRAMKLSRGAADALGVSPVFGDSDVDISGAETKTEVVVVGP